MNSASHRAALLALCLAVAMPTPVHAQAPVAEAQAAAERGEFRLASGLYLEAAKASQGALASDYSLLAAEALLAAGDAAGTEALLARQPRGALDDYQSQRAGLLRARALLARGDAAAALGALPATFDAPLAAAGLELRAQAQFATGDVLSGTATRVTRDSLLTEPALGENRQALWRELSRAAPVAAESSRDPQVRGWIELAELARQGAPLLAYDAWRASHPGHAGETQLAGLFMPEGMAAGISPLVPAAGAGGRDFALLLPLSGPLASAAQAIRAGAEAARIRAGETAPALSSHDTQAGLDSALHSALAAGAGVLIGPLRKEDVAALAARAPQRTTLALNYLDAGRVPPAGFTPFGLAPEDEARAAAAHAVSNGRQRALILAQEGDWGERVATAFRRQFELLGGSIVNEARFRAGSVDFSALLKPLLGLDVAEARAKKLAAIGIRTEFEPRPRGDVDVLFLGARAAQAKLIWPQLRFFRAGRLSSYAPAAAADAGPADLGGLQVCDAPWRLDTGGTVAVLRGTLATVNPRTADAQRLFALGYDAYDIAHRLVSGGLPPGEPLPGLSGILQIEADAAMHRRLDCQALVAAEPLRAEDLE